VNDPRKLLIVVGALLLAAGIFWPWLSRLGLGRLPGDIVIDRPGFHIYIPVATCLLISVVLTLLFWVFRK
jgi:membrane protein implicated in regulation of membrane protease activity